MEKEKKWLLDAYKLLEKCEGTLDPEIWDRLYYAIDMEDFSEIDCRVSAIPRRLLGHIRAALKGLPLMCPKAFSLDRWNLNEHVLSTKVKTLMNDLPTEERSVVFSTSIATIMVMLAIYTFCPMCCCFKYN
jgi:hypothetical protein